MAAELGIDQDAVVGKLLRVWTWADQNTVTCNGESNGVTVTSSFLDRLTFCQGFANAMREAGWLSGDDGALRFPNFERHNGKTAKERALSNRRVAKSRSGNAIGNGNVTVDVTVTPLQKPLPEKRREEVKAKDKSPNGDLSPAAPEDDAQGEQGQLIQPPAIPNCPHTEIIAAYHEILPELRRVREWTADRQRALRARWAENPKRQSVDWWRRYFTYVHDRCPFLMGRVEGSRGRAFDCDLEWLIRPRNMVKVLEGKYQAEVAA